MGIEDIPIEKVKTKDDFVQFLETLFKDYKKDGNKWENNNLERYLSALLANTKSIEHKFVVQGRKMPENIQWEIFAEILATAVVYE